MSAMPTTQRRPSHPSGQGDGSPPPRRLLPRTARVHEPDRGRHVKRSVLNERPECSAYAVGGPGAEFGTRARSAKCSGPGPNLESKLHCAIRVTASWGKQQLYTVDRHLPEVRKGQDAADTLGVGEGEGTGQIRIR